VSYTKTTAMMPFRAAADGAAFKCYSIYRIPPVAFSRVGRYFV